MVAEPIGSFADRRRPAPRMPWAENGAYAAYKSCHESCQQMSKTCTDMYVACTDKGVPRTRDIDTGYSLCTFCRDDCHAKRPYKYSECYKCGFE
jgi:hypothetical protein